MKILFPSDQIIETEHFNVGQDWETPIEGFFIIGANDKSKRSFADFSEGELHEFVDILRKVRLAMDTVLGIKDVYIFQNEDTEQGFHVWMFPRHDWMQKFGRKIESVRPIMKAALAERSIEPYLTEVKEAAKKVQAFLNK
ncbi:MAG: diadenosine tetraphosphate hydrolase [bacterium]|nr:diadenosine tetraphosphate hydrolase [bacterium]